MLQLILTAETYLNNGIKTLSRMRRRFFFGDCMILIYFTVFVTLAVAFVNGWTDAPNAIASCVSTGCMKLKHAVIVAAVADFAGAMIMGFLSGKVTETVIGIAVFPDNQKSVVALSSAMCAVVIWAVSAWKFGIPTSESHALIAGLTGAALAVNGGYMGIDFLAWSKVLKGLLFSLIIGLTAGYIISKLTLFLFRETDKNKSEKIFRYSQIVSCVLMAFMHGAQDSQKFAGILSLILSVSGIKSSFTDNRMMMLAVSSVAIAVGTATGGERIIKKVGTDMVKLRIDQGFSSDLSGAFCLFVSTVLGFPVSTTHTKTAAVIGVGFADKVKSVNMKIVGEMIAAWFFTFPGCGLIGWILTCICMKLI